MHFRYFLTDCITDMENKSEDEVDDLLLEIKHFWTGVLCEIHE